METILFVDDEEQILRALKRMFMDSEHEVITALGGEAALKVLACTHVDMVISDMRMPNMDGYQLLSKVKQLYPETIRIILSGYSDEKVVFQALQKNFAKVYLLKPWVNEELMSFIEQIFETEKALKNKNLLSLVNNVDHLPTIKANYQAIINLINQNVDMVDITMAIESDVSITAKVLQLANSVFYGLKTGSVKQAISYIGLENIKKLIMSTSIIDSMSSKGTAGGKIDNIWKISFVTNQLMAFIYKKHLNTQIPELYSTVGLLQDIGVIFFLKYFPQNGAKFWDKMMDAQFDVEETEREIYGVMHTEIGAYLLEWWEFPYPIVETALYHHDPFNKHVVNQELVCCAHIANSYARKLLGDNCMFNFNKKVFEVLKISEEEFEKSLDEFKTCVAN